VTGKDVKEKFSEITWWSFSSKIPWCQRVTNHSKGHHFTARFWNRWSSKCGLQKFI